MSSSRVTLIKVLLFAIFSITQTDDLILNWKWVQSVLFLQLLYLHSWCNNYHAAWTCCQLRYCQLICNYHPIQRIIIFTCLPFTIGFKRLLWTAFNKSAVKNYREVRLGDLFLQTGNKRTGITLSSFSAENRHSHTVGPKKTRHETWHVRLKSIIKASI